MSALECFDIGANRSLNLAERSGRSAKFSFADLIVLGVMHEAANTLGVRIVSVSQGFEELFVTAKSMSWNEFTDRYAVIDSERGYFVHFDGQNVFPTHCPCLILPCGPILEPV